MICPFNLSIIALIVLFAVTADNSSYVIFPLLHEIDRLNLRVHESVSQQKLFKIHISSVCLRVNHTTPWCLVE
jgi:hypothetical protein